MGAVEKRRLRASFLRQTTEKRRAFRSNNASVDSAEGGDGLLLLVVDLEERQESAHAEGLQDDLGGIDELERATGLLGELQAFDEEANPAGIESIHLRHAEDDLGFAVRD